MVLLSYLKKPRGKGKAKRKGVADQEGQGEVEQVDGRFPMAENSLQDVAYPSSKTKEKWAYR
jgi:hypothetical protein